MNKLKALSIATAVAASVSCFFALPVTFAQTIPATQEQEEIIETVVRPAEYTEVAESYIPQEYRKTSVKGSIKVVNVDFTPIIEGANTIEIWLGEDVGMITVEKTRSSKQSDGGASWYGTVKEYLRSTVSISITNRFGTYIGYISITINSRKFEMKTLNHPYLHFVREVDREAKRSRFQNESDYRKRSR